MDLFGNFGKSKIGNLNIVDYYNLEKNFSYWNLSFFIEKNFYKQNFFEIIKICALDCIVNEKKSESYNFKYVKQKFDEFFFKNYCLNKKIILKIKSSEIKKENTNNLYIKNFIRILVFIYNRINFKKNNLIKQNLFFSYFENTDNISKKKVFIGRIYLIKLQINK